MNTIAGEIEKTFPQAEWGRFDDIERVFGLRRSTTYNLLRQGVIRSAAVRRKGARNGVRLIDLQSVRDFLKAQSS